MRRAFACRERFALVFCALSVGLMCAVSAQVAAAPSQPPSVFSISSSSTRAVVLESVSMRGEPFSLTSEGNFSPADPRTRITLFGTNFDFLQGEGASALTADAQDGSGNLYPLKVEYVGTVPNFDGIYMVVLRLNDNMTSNLGDVLVRLNLHGMASNRVRVAIGQIGGGPADDSAPNPAPATPPGAATPLTLAQYQAQYNNPSFASDSDLRRFLEQASWGGRGDDADFNHLKAIGIPAYINEQFNTPPMFVDSSTDPKFSLSSNYSFSSPYPQFYPGSPAPPCDSSTTCFRDNYTLYQQQRQFMLGALTQPDQLRQRVSFAFHKFIVVGGQVLNGNQPYWYSPYLQTIDRNAFGSFRSMLFDVTLNPGMGEYLNMRGNSVISLTNPTPNENYAREIMQLFSIGVDTLNQDGTPVLDSQGNRVPSYDQNTITNLARVFTGWDLDPAAKISGVDGTTAVPNWQDPMTPNVNRNRYDTNQKTLLVDIRSPNPVVIPACGAPCTTGTSAQMLAADQAYAITSLGQAIDNLFFHPNTGPFVCMQMIHQLVTSNPSPAYVGRCAASFADNGAGVRGDMKAVITEVLLDPEARGDVKTDPNYGHLREPVLLMTSLLRAFGATDTSKTDGVLVSNSPNNFTTPLGQNVFNPPTVFSYFPADFGLPGTNLIGPEFGILDTSTSYARSNFMNTLFLTNTGVPGIPTGTNRPIGTKIDYSTFQAMAAADVPGLVNALNVRLMHGTMSSQMNASIVATVNAISSADPGGRTRTAIYLVASSSQYQVER